MPEHIVTALRELITSEFDQLFTTAKSERKAQIAERDRLYDERTKLLQAHYAGAVPLDLLKIAQDSGGRLSACLDARIEASETEYRQPRARLDDCLAVAGHAHAIYTSIDASPRRTPILASFDRLASTDDDTKDPDLGVPLDTFFIPEV